MGKKNRGKLRLDKSRIRQLSDAEAKQAGGGALYNTNTCGSDQSSVPTMNCAVGGTGTCTCTDYCTDGCGSYMP